MARLLLLVLHQGFVCKGATYTLLVYFTADCVDCATCIKGGSVVGYRRATVMGIARGQLAKVGQCGDALALLNGQLGRLKLG